MTHFRFRYRCAGRLRRHTTSQPAELSVLPGGSADPLAASATPWRRMLAETVVFGPVLSTLRIGQFLVSHEGDPQLSGHPDIRY